jgi:hypothetical protein
MDISDERKELIRNFIDGPLKIYLTEDISYGRFIEMINEKFGTDFKYSDLYPCYLFNMEPCGKQE